MSLFDVEDRIEHALFSGALRALDLYSAAGAKKPEERGGGPLTLDDFYGREISEIRRRVEAPPALTDEQRQEQQAKLEYARMQVYEAQIRASRPQMIEGDPAPPAEASPE